jgi:DNA recombination protein RmuC
MCGAAGNKNYQVVPNRSPILYLAFLSNPFAMALNEDTTLCNKAFRKNIVISSPATLWRLYRPLTACGPEPKQQENAFEIARQARL